MKNYSDYRDAVDLAQSHAALVVVAEQAETDFAAGHLVMTDHEWANITIRLGARVKEFVPVLDGGRGQVAEFISGPCANLHAVWVKDRPGPYIYSFADRDYEGQAKAQAEGLAQALTKLGLHF